MYDDTLQAKEEKKPPINYMHVHDAAWQRVSHDTCLVITNREREREKKESEGELQRDKEEEKEGEGDRERERNVLRCNVKKASAQKSSAP